MKSRGSKKRSTVVVTGGAGFIGSHLCDRFIAEGCDVVCIDNLITGSRENIRHLLGGPRFRFIEHNVSKHFRVRGRVDYVLHFASPASPEDYLRYPIPTLKAGSLGTHNALGFAKEKNARFLLASTSEVYGDPAVHPQPETYWGNVNPIGVRGCYDEAKRFAEAITMAYFRSHGVNTGIARIFNTYGPRMRINDGRVVPNFVCQALRGTSLTVYGTGRQTRSFCYVDDLIEGIVRLLYSPVHDPVNLGNPTEFTVIGFARLVIRATGSRSRIIHKPLPQDDPRQRRPDISRARKLLKWSPSTGLEKGLETTVGWFGGRCRKALISHK